MSKSDAVKKIKASGQIKAVLFDLGKVILHFNFEPAFKRLSKASGHSTQEIEQYFRASGLEVLYDGGKITSHYFYHQIKKALDLKIEFGEFKKIWNEIFTPKNEIIGLIRELSQKKYRLVMISNTNAMHYEYIQKKYPILEKFDRIILSYKEKMRKPDDRIYRKAAKACQATPNEIYYIDDRRDLTDAARELGFHAFTYQNNFKELLADIKKKGISIHY